MSARDESIDTRDSNPGDNRAVIERLVTLGPEAQGEIDQTLLRENLKRTPLERLQAANEAANQIEVLRHAMNAAGHG